MTLASRIALYGLLALVLGSSSGAQDLVLQDLNEALGRARYSEALQLTGDLEDPALAAEWRSYLFGLAGDVPGALREARRGLEQAPGHAGLLTQALNASLTLGLAQSASDLSQRLVSTVQHDPALAERALELQGLARELAGREALAERSVARSRAVALAGLLGALLALALLTRGAPEPV